MLRIYILTNNDLFGEGVVNLLRLESDIEIVGQGAELEQACAEIQRLQPEAVIVESSNLRQESMAMVTRILEMETPVNVISLDLSENKVHLYHAEEREATCVKDLVDAMKMELSA